MDEPASTTRPDDGDRLPPADLKHRVRAGLVAMVIGQVLGLAIQIPFAALLLRLVDITEFGLFEMVGTVLQVMPIFCQMGLNVGAIQEASLTGERRSALFWLTMTFGVVTALATAGFSPLVAWWFHQPRLVYLTLAMAAAPLLVSCMSQHNALLERGLKLPQLATLRVLARIGGGGAGVTAALLGAGVYSLVAQVYAELTLLAAGVWWLEPWRPSFRIEPTSARHLIRFGGFYSAAELTFVLGRTLDKLLIGRWLGPVSAGLYGQAFTWTMKPIAIMIPILGGLLLPSLARSAYDKDLYTQVWYSFSRLVGMILIPGGIGMAIVGPEMMVVLAGERWLEAGYLVRVVALTLTVQGFINLAGSVLCSVGRADRLFYASVGLLLALVISYALGYVIGASFGDPIMGIAAAYTIAVLVLFVPYMAFCLSAASVSVRDWLWVLVPIVIPALVMGAVVLGLHVWLVNQQARPAAMLLVEVLAGVAVFLLLAYRQVIWILSQLRTTLAGAPVPAT